MEVIHHQAVDDDTDYFVSPVSPQRTPNRRCSWNRRRIKGFTAGEGPIWSYLRGWFRSWPAAQRWTGEQFCRWVICGGDFVHLYSDTERHSAVDVPMTIRTKGRVSAEWPEKCNVTKVTHSRSTIGALT